VTMLSCAVARTELAAIFFLSDMDGDVFVLCVALFLLVHLPLRLPRSQRPVEAPPSLG